MLTFHKSKSIKVFFGISLFLSITGAAVAAPDVEKREYRSDHAKIQFSADTIKAASDGKGSMLNGNVQVSVGNKIKISADKVLVKYADAKQYKVAEFTIFGKGTFQSGKNTIAFTNGTYNPNTKQLSAEHMGA